MNPAIQTSPSGARNSETTSQSRRSKVHVGVVGCGKIAEQHLRFLTRYQNCQIQSICDLSPAVARFTADRFGLREFDTSLESMLERHPLDVVHVLTPAASHGAIAKRCLEAGLDVIVEKPVALCHAELLALWKTAQSRDSRLIENHNYRFNKPFRWLQESLERGYIGEIKEVEVRLALRIRDGGRYADLDAPHPSHRLPAGVIHEFISHLCYLVLRLCPEETTSVRASWQNVGGGEVFKYDHLDALLEFGTTRARLVFTCQQWPDEFSVVARGSSGHAFIEMFHPTCQLVRKRRGSQHLVPFLNSVSTARSSLASGTGGLWNKIAGRTSYEGLERFLQLTYAAIDGGGAPPVSFTDMDRTIRLVDALLAPENQT